MTAPDSPTVPALLRRAVEQAGSHTYVVEPGGQVTYAEADARSADAARWLLRVGVGKGARVGLFFPNGVDWVVWWLAASRIGAVVVPLSTMYRPAEIAKVLRLADVAILVAPSRILNFEVADRLAAAPGSKVYGVPSVKARWYGDVARVGTVGRTVFWPAPNVDSGLVALTRTAPPATTATREQVFAVVDAAFAQRRKTLRAALAGWAGSAAAAGAALEAAGVDPTLRGERLTVEQFAAIAAARSAR